MLRVWRGGCLGLSVFQEQSSGSGPHSWPPHFKKGPPLHKLEMRTTKKKPLCCFSKDWDCFSTFLQTSLPTRGQGLKFVF